MTGSLALEIQELARPELDEVFDALGMSVTVSRAAPVPDAPPPDLDPWGGLTLPPAASGAQESAIYPAYGYQLSTRERQEKGIGADIPVPIWEVLVHHAAPLDEPGFSLTLHGGELPAPLALDVIGDAEDIGAVRVCWRLLCRAPGARHALGG
ncbi:hypothetical protein Dcar01_03535 [Deinococcus carri]|uniref:Uncharacterized protein n=1 Tax=Deinococcus carri TaxID=1211323 RepID=A0ABP9WBS3_9DEIO